MTRNVRALRDEIVDLGPYAFREITFDTAIEDCMPVWQRRYGFEVRLSIERIELPPEMAGDLFRIAQEAVVNAGRHADADRVELSLRTVGGQVELRVADNGHGFDGNGGLTASPSQATSGWRACASVPSCSTASSRSSRRSRGTRVLVRAPLSPVAAA